MNDKVVNGSQINAKARLRGLSRVIQRFISTGFYAACWLLLLMLVCAGRDSASSVIRPGSDSGGAKNNEKRDMSDVIACNSDISLRLPEGMLTSSIIGISGWEILDVYLITAGAGQPILISRDKANDQPAFYRGIPRWSPGRMKLAWPGQEDLFVTDVTTSATHLVYHVCEAKPEEELPTWGFAWAGDCQRLAVWRGKDGQTAICRLDGTIEKTIEPINGTTLAGLDWSTQGILAQVFREANGQYAIYSMQPDVAPQRSKVIGFPKRIEGLRFSPNGDELVFIGEKESDWSVYVLGLQGKTLSEVFQGVEAENSMGRYPHHPGCRPRWSPDGKQLLLASHNHLYVIRKDGAQRRDLTPNGKKVAYATWSPDGQRIAFQMGGAGGEMWGIWVMRANGGNPTLAAPRGAWWIFPEWGIF